MVYTDIAIMGFLFSILFDLFILKTRLLMRAVFWTSYAIILPFQLITNWWLTSRSIVMYSPDAIIGIRIASAWLCGYFGVKKIFRKSSYLELRALK